MKSFSVLLLTASLVSAAAVPGAVVGRSAEVGHVSAAVEVRDATVPTTSVFDPEDDGEDEEEDLPVAPITARAEEAQDAAKNGTAPEAGKQPENKDGQNQNKDGKNQNQNKDGQNQNKDGQNQNKDGKNQNNNQNQNKDGKNNNNNNQNQNQNQNNQDLINQLLQNGNLNQGVLNPWLVSNIGQLGLGQQINVGNLNSISLAQQIALVSQVQQLQTLQQLQLIQQPQIITVLNQGFVNQGATIAIVG
ncbi:hypothetical protein LEL_00936 [Akanthomyces lecanii RCEF 1005]|uniref:Uncharacterized protein n=1 Tax=Akanthomyces lecanii RCEF 1005 TaxID=1081108 RepID=A0A168K998_CORDF|nr:hypothetical protein LEL_00936 [Akanthomyces lecanii RCEF 1005]